MTRQQHPAGCPCDQPATTWPVHHPGIGTLHYPTEAEARVAAGTAGTLLPPVTAIGAVLATPTPGHNEDGQHLTSLDIAAAAIPNDLFNTPVVGAGGARRAKAARYVLNALAAAGRLAPENDAAEDDPMPAFVLKGKDALAPGIIDAYRRECARHGLDGQAAEVALAFREMAAWQLRNPERVKLPDHRHVPVRPAQTVAAASATPTPVHTPQRPAATATAGGTGPVVLTWDWRGQPDLDHLAEALHNLGGPHLHQVDTESDEYAIVLATQHLDQAWERQMLARLREKYGDTLGVGE